MNSRTTARDFGSYRYTVIRRLACEAFQSLFVIAGCVLGVGHVSATGTERFPPRPRMEPHTIDPMQQQPHAIPDAGPNVLVS